MDVLISSLFVGGLFVSSIMSAAAAESRGGVEVVEVTGIIDASVERAVMKTIEGAERSRAALVALQIDSEGVVDSARTRRMIKRISRADVPIGTWIGPAGARAANGAALIADAGHLRAIAPGALRGPVETTDLRHRVLPSAVSLRPPRADRAASLSELLEQIDDREVLLASGSRKIAIDPARSSIRFHNLDLFGRVLHAAAQPSITYLLLLLALVGIVFELFHPSTGPAGLSGLAAGALAVYGVLTLGGSWLGVALIVLGVAGFAVDLRYASLGPLTAAGFAALVAGSLLLFPGRWLRIDPLVLAFGIISMVAFLLGAMTRVLRDLRAVARGELQVHDAHRHPEEE